MTTATDELSKGTLIDGRYEIRELLGRGGMGAVYRAVDMKLGQTVAVKLLLTGNPDSRSRDERRRRFLREVLAINEVQHRNVVHIQEFGFHRDTPYMVMEFLKGKDLGRVLLESERPLPIQYVVDVLLVVCAAIRACHKAVVIHRDLKPGNIMLIETDAGNGWDVKVVDFSISKSSLGSDLTQEGKVVGTPRYLAPEQLKGKAGPESDQYAIGMLLYVCLTKRHPFEERKGMALVRAIESGDVGRPREHRPEIPLALEEIVLRALRVAPGERHASVFELGQRLWEFASPLGRENWKKFYFHTPSEARSAVGDGTPSTLGVPLVRRMAEGELDLGTETVVARYDGATAFREAVTERTLDDPEAKLLSETPANADSENEETPATAPNVANAELPTPSAWSWQTTSTGDAPVERGAKTAEPRRSGPRRLAVVAGGIAVFLFAGILGAGLMRRHLASGRDGAVSEPSGEPFAPVAEPAPEPTRVPPAPPPPSAPPPSLSARSASLATTPAAETRPASAAPDGRATQREPATKKTAGGRRKLKSRAAGGAGGWELDGNGIPIPP